MAGNRSEKEEPAEKELTFEEAQAQLESIVAAIEQGKIGLEESVSQYEKGMKLIRRCRSILADAEAKIQQLQLAEDGTLTPTPVAPPPQD